MSNFPRCHLAELIVAAAVLVCVLLLNAWPNDYPLYILRESYGWPWTFFQRHFTRTATHTLSALAGNAAIAIVLATGAGLLIRALKHANGTALRMHLLSSVALSLVWGVLLWANLLVLNNQDGCQIYGWPNQAVAFRYQPSRFALLLKPEEWKPHYYISYINVARNVFVAFYIGLAVVTFCETVAAYWRARRNSSQRAPL